MVASRKSRKRVLKSTRRSRVAKSRRLKRVKTRRRVHKRKMKRKRMSKRRRRGGVNSERVPSYTTLDPEQVAPSYEVSQSLASKMGLPDYQPPPPSFDNSQKVKKKENEAQVYSNKVSPADQRRYEENAAKRDEYFKRLATQQPTPKSSVFNKAKDSFNQVVGNIFGSRKTKRS